MTDRPRLGDATAAATVLGFILLNQPLVGLFDGLSWFAGIPASVAYVFGAWAVLIVLLAWIMRPGARTGTGGKD